MNWYTLKEVAYKLQVTPRTIYTYLKSGFLKGKKIGGKWHFSVDVIEEIIQHHQEILRRSPIAMMLGDENREEVNTMFSIDIKLNEKALEKLISLLIDQYNQVYEGENERFYFYKYEDKANITIVGTISYIQQFAPCITKQVIEFEKKERKNDA